MRILIILILLTSCSTMKKAKIYSGVVGGLIGGFVGTTVGLELSPNRDSDNINKNIGTTMGILTGTLVGTYLGKSLYEEDPENLKGDPIEIEYRNAPNKKDELVPISNSSVINLSDLGITLDPSKSVAFKTETTSELPRDLKGDVYKQVVIRHVVPTRKIKLKNGKTYILKETELIEHRFVE